MILTSGRTPAARGESANKPTPPAESISKMTVAEKQSTKSALHSAGNEALHGPLIAPFHPAIFAILFAPAKSTNGFFLFQYPRRAREPFFRNALRSRSFPDPPLRNRFPQHPIPTRVATWIIWNGAPWRERLSQSSSSCCSVGPSSTNFPSNIDNIRGESRETGLVEDGIIRDYAGNGVHTPRCLALAPQPPGLSRFACGQRPWRSSARRIRLPNRRVVPARALACRARAGAGDLKPFGFPLMGWSRSAKNDRKPCNNAAKNGGPQPNASANTDILVCLLTSHGRTPAGSWMLPVVFAHYRKALR